MLKIGLICAVALSAVSVSACSTYGDDYAYASPRERCLRDRDNNRVAGTVAGGVLGALAGTAIAGNDSNAAGAVVGGVAGAVVGNQVAKGRPCPPGYYYRD
jgi:outer membrane lipoprotein SlyB